MKNETMTPQWVVENFLPDYANRFDNWVNVDDGIACMPYNSFYTKHFPEALSELLKAQREECYEAWHSAIAEKGEPYYESIATAIRNSPIPEPKNKK